MSEAARYACAASGLAVFLFVRYIAIRRKTIERAYVYFALRGQFEREAVTKAARTLAPARPEAGDRV